ncbi:hypothetical protein V8D89_003329 [Ganoderma adspersum]
MDSSSYVISLDQMVNDFLPPREPEHSTSEAIQNVFTNVPTFASERDMYKYITAALHGSKACPLVVKSFDSRRDGLAKQNINCGRFASVRAHVGEGPASPKETKSSLRPWSHLDLLIKCQLDPVAEDPFDEGSGEHEDVRMTRLAVFMAVFMVLFLGHYARVLRFDRSGVVAFEKIDYVERGNELTAFLVRYRCLGSVDRGHGPRASLITTTDPLWHQLKKHGVDAAKKDLESHIPKAFNESLDRKWPWWKLSVVDEETGVERYFAYYTARVVGRGTSSYVAVPLNDAREPEGDFVYLKDTWRRDKEGLHKEGTVLKTLNADQVTYVPTLIYHGDLNQSALSYDKWFDYHPDRARDECPLEAHRHYRLVVAEVCKLLSEFQAGAELVWALICGIMAHEKACAAGYIHRDNSAGNILLYRDANDVQGTWQFMSARTQLSKARSRMIVDDLESFFHVLVYYAVRFLPTNLSDEVIPRFFYCYFHDYTDEAYGHSCGQLKYNTIRRGVIDTMLVSRSFEDAEGRQTVHLNFYSPPNCTVSRPDGEPEEGSDGVTFQALYELPMCKKDGKGKDQGKAAKPSCGRGTSASGTTAMADITAQVAERVKTHEAMIWLMLTHLTVKLGWPQGDKGKDREPSEDCASEQENAASSSGSIDWIGSKRAREESDEEEGVKRVRNCA